MVFDVGMVLMGDLDDVEFLLRPAGEIKSWF